MQYYIHFASCWKEMKTSSTFIVCKIILNKCNKNERVKFNLKLSILIFLHIYKAVCSRTPLSFILFQDQATAKRWLNISFWLNILEVGSLCGVTYISNRENYRKLHSVSQPRQSP